MTCSVSRPSAWPGLKPPVLDSPTAVTTDNLRTQSPVTNTLIVSIAVGTVAGLVDSTFLWDMVSMGTLVAFIVVSVAVPVIRRKQGDTGRKGFRVPFGPYLVPGLSIIACLYLVCGLSSTTYTVFTIWMTVAVLTYFGYGIHNRRISTSARAECLVNHENDKSIPSVLPSAKVTNTRPASASMNTAATIPAARSTARISRTLPFFPWS
jgi:hypothetical protein